MFPIAVGGHIIFRTHGFAFRFHSKPFLLDHFVQENVSCLNEAGIFQQIAFSRTAYMLQAVEAVIEMVVLAHLKRVPMRSHQR